jgi:hypothetical protein
MSAAAAPQYEAAGPSWSIDRDARTNVTLMERDNRAGYSIFIAHAPADTGVAEELTPLLAETGATVLSGADTSLSTGTQEELEQAALAADAYVALLSPASIASPRMRALTRKYHDVRKADARRILLPVSIAPLTPDLLWPFLLEYERIEAVPRTINEIGERPAISPEMLALAVLQGLHLPVSARLLNVSGTPVEQPQLLLSQSRPISAPLTGSLAPQLQLPERRPWRPWRPSGPLALGAVAAALVLALLATLAFSGGVTPYHLDGLAPPRPTVTSRTLIVTMSTPDATALVTPSSTGAATGPAAPQPTATSAPSSTATLSAPPTATTSPPPLLTLGALHLIHAQGNQCAGAQTVANGGAQQMTWQWASIQPSAHSSFLYGVNTTAQFGGLPADQFPGVAAGTTETLNVQMRCTGQSYTITLRDGLGRTQQFTMISD